MQLRQLDEDDEEETYFFCFKIKRNKQPSRSSKTSQNDKMSMQYLSFDHHIEESRGQIIEDSKYKLTDSVLKISDYPKNKLFFLRNKASKEEIIAKITEKRFNTNDLSSSTLSLDSSKSPIQEQLQKIEHTPDNIARYIAKRMKEFVIITDLGCGTGGNTVQLAKECHYVIGVEIDSKFIELAKKNCQNSIVNVDLINADIFTLNNLQTDVIFVNPSLNPEALYSKDQIKNCNPDIKKILLNHQKNTKNFVFQLPPQIDISQLPLLLNINSQFAYFRQNFPSFLSIEVEQIILNNQLEYIVVYCGDVSDIKQSEIIKFLTKQFRKAQPDFNSIQKQHLFWLFELIFRHIGIQHLTYRTVEAIKQKKSIENFCKFIQQQFQIQQDLYQTYINHNKNIKDDIYSAQKQDIDQQDIDNMSPSNFSYKQIEVANMNYSYTNENVFDDEEVETQNSFVMNFKH
ncbi:unnamed protein product (macronuclear) [Paramecium tetraurelia]|uniref:Trimethylguanosine synthase n=1 Tax=Paramecium tetraurelia TaxID=5888 RepID=A0CPQ3_PARTE|nr:uncharacterized protein GSPATT00009162001 [Paramecium tetraurelia]CAK72770.1 unnamed protein product [Paramecium tetraurelia]|eukprot:XP_001440167.1 hypothetical protein (macronuclear) [Paramecium tetraurelia strain d4-2]